MMNRGMWMSNFCSAFIPVGIVISIFAVLDP